MTLSPVDMNEVGAGDIAVGQRWLHACGRNARQRDVYEVRWIDDDHVVLTKVGWDDTQRVSFGSLLAYWVLLR